MTGICGICGGHLVYVGEESKENVLDMLNKQNLIHNFHYFFHRYVITGKKFSNPVFE